MVKGLRFSIRYKLLFLLCFLTATVLTIFLLLSTDLFKRDKTAYVFDASATFSRSLASSLRTEIVNTTEKVNILLTGFDGENRKFGEMGEQLFDRFPRIKHVLLVEESSGGLEYKKVASLERKEMSLEISQESLKQMVARVVENQLYFAPFGNNNMWALSLHYQQVENASSKIYLVVLFESMDLTKSFESQQSFSSFVLDESGKMIIKGNKVQDSYIKLFTNSKFFHRINQNFLPEGTAEVVFKGHEPKLASYHRVGEGKLIVFTEISKSVAFQTVDMLLKKSALFFLALISLSIVFAVIFSNSLTSSLRHLTSAVEHIASGNFDFKVSVKSRDEIGVLADGVNAMSEKISDLLFELEKYSEQLEQMVEDRTKELKEANILIKTMIDSLGQGLLVFDREGKCLPVFTNACIELFEVSPKEKNVWDVLAIQDESKVKTFKKWMSSIFKQMIPFKDMAFLGTTHVEKENGKYISIDYRPMENEDNELTGVVLVATDKTQEQLAKSEAHRNQEYSNMIIKIVRNKEQFLNFIKEAQELIKKLEAIIQMGKTGNFDLKSTKLFLHSIKGSAGVYSLSELQKMVHDYETELDKFKDKTAEELLAYLPQLEKNVEQLKQLFGKYLEEFSHFLGESIIDGHYRIEIIHDHLQGFAKKLYVIGDKNPIYMDFVNSFVKVPIINFFKGYSDVVIDLAKRRGKEVLPILFQGGDIRITKSFYSEFFTVVVHAFTNAIDHGIETPEERQSQGKANAGQIIVSFFRQVIKGNDYLKIMIHDDGKGIDPAKIRQKLIDKGVPKESIETDDFDVIQHIFDDSFSTADILSLTSGRGVGTGAIKDVATRMGGMVTVGSEVGKGTRFLIILPYC